MAFSQQGLLNWAEDNIPPDELRKFDGNALLWSLTYIASYPDLIAAFSADPWAGLNHYYAYGRFEGRSASFDPASYINTHRDIGNAFGTDQWAASVHFIHHGRAVQLNNTVTGTSGNNELIGGDGSDRLVASAGNDVLNGDNARSGFNAPGKDYDIADYSGLNTGITLLSQGRVSKSGLGKDQLSGIEEIRANAAFVNTIDGRTEAKGNAAFDVDLLKESFTLKLNAGPATFKVKGFDNLVGTKNADTLRGDHGNNVIDGGDGTANAFDTHLNSAEAQIFRMYATALGRDPDNGGFKGWVHNLESGKFSLQQVAERFLKSAEFKREFGTLSDAEFVQQLYEVGLGRAPDAGGFKGWLNALANGMPREQVLVGFSQSREQIHQTDDDFLYFIGSRFGYDDKLVGNGGADRFVFAGNFERDIVYDFDQAENDIIDVSGAAGMDNFRDLLVNHSTQVGAHTVITDAEGNSITLMNIDRSSLGADDFIF